MTFAQFWSDNQQKVFGTVTAFFSVLAGLLAAGTFEPVLSEYWITWLGIISALVTGVAGVGTVQSGYKNTTKERVAASAATIEVAKAAQGIAMKSAIEATPGGSRD